MVVVECQLVIPAAKSAAGQQSRFGYSKRAAHGSGSGEAHDGDRPHPPFPQQGSRMRLGGAG
jgi:hypothetical protein